MEDMAASSGDVADGEVMSPIGRGDGGKAAVTSRSDTTYPMGTQPAAGAQPLATQANTDSNG